MPPNPRMYTCCLYRTLGEGVGGEGVGKTKSGNAKK